MENLLSFVNAYVGPILTVIFGMAAVCFYTPKKKRAWNIVIKTGLVLLGIAVIVMCYIYYSGDERKPGGETNLTENTTIAVEETDETKNRTVNVDLTRVLEANAYATIEASSTYNGDSANHNVRNLTDNKLKTNWTEGVHGNGEGEYIEFTFHMEQPIAGFVISAGNHSSNTYYTKNSRPKSIILTFSDGSEVNYTLLDKKETQKIYFDEVVDTTSARLTIGSVYSGSAWEDTVISEFAFLIQES